MAISIQKLTNFYILSTFALFAYTFTEVYKKADNYFSAALIYLDQTITNFIFYNLIFSMGILFYKACIWVFFMEVKENETIVSFSLKKKMVDKLKAKIIDVILFCYIMDGQIQMNSFTCIVFIFFSYILHCMAIFRAEYLIHTPASLSLNLNYRLTALFLLLIFFDYQLLIYSFQLLYSQSATHFIFVYYTIIISLSLIEPIVKYFFDFYEKYTLCHIRNIDERLALISLWISVPRLLIQILLSICLAMKFNIFFYLMFTVIELVSQLSHTIKSYNRVKKLTDTMKNLKKIDEEEIKKHHDNTCMVCFQDMTEATLLPCKHFFHDECLRQWIIKNSNHFCPKCKKEFNFDNKKEEKKQVNEEGNRVENQRQTQEKIRQERIKRLEKLQEKMYRNKDKKKDKRDPNHLRPLADPNEARKQLKDQTQIKPDYKQLIRESLRQQQQSYQSLTVPKPEPSRKSHSQQQISHLGLQQLGENLQILGWDTPLQIVEQKQRRRQFVRMGSLAYGLPTQAVYRRTYRHMYVRDNYEVANQALIKDFSLGEYQQMMLFADQ